VEEPAVEIRVRDDGPYKVTGPVRVVDAEGNAWVLDGDRPSGAVPLREVEDEAVLRPFTPR